MIELLSILIPVICGIAGTCVYHLRQINKRLDKLDIAVCQLMSEKKVRQLVDDKLEPLKVQTDNIDKSLMSATQLLLEMRRGRLN